MKKILFASTAAVAMTVGGMAAAQGVTVFGDARLGFGYNVNQGGTITDDEADTFDEVLAISRVRFGVRMTGETETGITYGATIRADNAGGGVAGTAGNVFVSGAFGTLTYGDIAAAHQQHTGDLPEIGLTGLGFLNEPNYLGNRATGAENRPTVRYDFDVAGFGISAGTNNELDDIGVGVSFSPQFGGGSLTIGGGYYEQDDATEWSAAIGGSIAGFTARLIYTNTDGTVVDADGDDVELDGETLGLGLGTTIGDIGLNAFYREAFGDGTDLFDGSNAWGVGFTFNLGGGASLRGGYVNTFDNVDAADFGIQLSF